MNEASIFIETPDRCHISKKRILGAAFFGFITSSFVTGSLHYSVPRILATVQKIEPAVAIENYESSLIWSIAAYTIAILLGSMTAGYISRTKGGLAGLLSHLIYAAFIGLGLVLAIISQTDGLTHGLSIQLYLFLSLLFTVGMSVLGGWLGSKFYDKENDTDLGKDKLTIFGIRWFHYLWLFPVIIFSTMTTLVYVIYAALLAYLSDLYLAIHPSLWFNFSWWLYAAFAPVLIYAAWGLGFSGIAKVFETMEYGQIKTNGWKKFGSILLYGILFPAISSLIAFLAITITHHMPRPAHGDWKIGLSLILIFPVIAGIIALVGWLKKCIRERRIRKSSSHMTPQQMKLMKMDAELRVFKALVQVLKRKKVNKP